MQIYAGPYKYQGLQVLVTVVLGLAHAAFYVTLLVFHLLFVVMPLPTIVGITIGALEIAISAKLPESVTVLKLWLFAAGTLTTIYSVGCLAYVLIVLS
jgi:predicted metal-binding membrane protein